MTPSNNVGVNKYFNQALEQISRLKCDIALKRDIIAAIIVKSNAIRIQKTIRKMQNTPTFYSAALDTTAEDNNTMAAERTLRKLLSEPVTLAAAAYRDLEHIFNQVDALEAALRSNSNSTNIIAIKNACAKYQLGVKTEGKDLATQYLT